MLATREWCFPSFFLTKEEGWWWWWWWGGLTECAGLIIKQLFAALHGGSGPKCADAGKISKWCICTTRRISNVELMITLGWDRYCQKVTRRQGNGLLQACTVWQGGGGGRGWQRWMEKRQGRTITKGKKDISLRPSHTISVFSVCDIRPWLIYASIKFFFALHCCHGTSLVRCCGQSGLCFRFVFISLSCPQHLICNKHC